MTRILVVLSLCFIACTPPKGEKGDIGPKGDMGALGPVGGRGPAGPSAVSISPLPSGAICPNGGALMQDQDGGLAALCNGSPGQVGSQGAVGPVGPRGLSASSLTIWQSDGGEVGPILSNGTNTLESVYMIEAGCIAQLDWANNMVKPFQSRIWYTQTNCTGLAFADFTIPLYPMTCMAVGTQAFRSLQPVMQQKMNAQSLFEPWSTSADGGVITRCSNQVNSTSGVVVEMINLPVSNGPFTFGKQ